MDSVKKDRWFSCVTYGDEDYLKRVLLANSNHIRAWAYCVHDKENDYHIHLLLRTYNSYTFKAILNWFRDVPQAIPQNTFVEKIIDKQGAVDYLTHKHEPDKYHYDEESIVAQNLNDFIEEASAKDSSYEIIVDMIRGLSYRALAFKYGRDFIYHFKQFDEIVKNIKTQERSAMLALENDINSMSIFDYIVNEGSKNEK